MLWMLCLNPWVIDGDSVRCSNLGEIRLLGIDSADYSSSPPCRGHFGDHVCDDAQAKAAKRGLIALKYRLGKAEWKVLPAGRDRYGRLLARVVVGEVGKDGRPARGSTDLGCYQLGRGSARYIVAYDDGGRVAKACGLR